MGKYILRRLLMTIPTIIIITVIIFVVLRIIPGSIVATMFGGTGGGEGMQMVDPAAIEKLMSDLKLDQPLYVQYSHWIKGLVTGDMGNSFFRGQRVSEIIFRQGPVTLQIAIMAIALSWIIGLPVGILSASKQDSFADYSSRIFVVLFLAIPSFWLASLIVLATVSIFEWYPPLFYVHIWDDPIGNLSKTIAPAIVLGLGMAAMIARMSRSTILEVLREDYVRTATAKGLSSRVIMWRHVIKNALLPVITISGIMMGFTLGGSVAVELAFSINGLGLTMLTAIVDKDFNVVQNLVLIYAVAFVFINLLIDLSYAWADPRIHYQ
jgi:peptide/nickel transport system permease protein